MTDVTIPQDVAKMIASFIRSTVGPESSWLNEADLLDPPPAPTLRKQIAHMLGDGLSRERATDYATADAVLAVVADWLEAQPLAPSRAHDGCLARKQRDHDVRLLREETP